MNRKFCLFFLPLLATLGCQEKGDTSREEAREGVRDAINAPADYVGANIRAGQQAQVTTATTSVNSAIRMFQAQEGRNPRSLNELVEEGYLPAIPDLPRGASFEYDAETGEATVSGN